MDAMCEDAGVACLRAVVDVLVRADTVYREDEEGDDENESEEDTEVLSAKVSEVSHVRMRIANIR